MNVQFDINDSKWMDHIYYTCPKEQINWQYWKFPATFRGSQGLYEAYRYLYKTSQRHQGLISDDKIYLSQEHNQLLMEELIFQERTKWRKANNIDETTTLIFVSPGSTEAEAKSCLPTIAKAVDLFIAEYTKDNTVTKENFAVVVSVPESNLF